MRPNERVEEETVSHGDDDAAGAPTTADVRPSERTADVLADERRRALVSYLDGKTGDTASFVELIDHLAGRESRPVAQSTAERIAVSLYYVHLPRLADAGVVEYDRRSRTVRYRAESGATGASSR